VSPKSVPPTMHRKEGPPPDGLLFGASVDREPEQTDAEGLPVPADNWVAWRQVGRMERTHVAGPEPQPRLGFWERPEEALDRAAEAGCTTFLMPIEWARVHPHPGVSGPDSAVLARYAAVAAACGHRQLEPVVSLHHFTHPGWLGEDFWLRPDAPARVRIWVERVVGALGGSVRHWITLGEVNSLVVRSWLAGTLPPGRTLAFVDASLALDNLLCGHVVSYEAIHAEQPDAEVTMTTGPGRVYEFDGMMADLLVARSEGVCVADLDAWIAQRRVRYDTAFPALGPGERLVRRLGAAWSSYGARGMGRAGRPSRLPRRAIDALYGSPHPRTLDVLGLSLTAPIEWAVGRLRGSGALGATGPVNRPPDLARWLIGRHSLTPGLPIWVVDGAPATDVGRDQALRENVGAVMVATDAQVPVTRFWHRMEAGDAGAYGAVIAGLHRGDRSVLGA